MTGGTVDERCLQSIHERRLYANAPCLQLKCVVKSSMCHDAWLIRKPLLRKIFGRIKRNKSYRQGPTRSLAPEMPTMQLYSLASCFPDATASEVSAVLSTPRVTAPAAPAMAMISDALPRIKVGLSLSSETIVCSSTVPFKHHLTVHMF